MGDCHPVGEGIQELRIHFGPGYRLYFAKMGETVILLLCAGSKRTQDQDIRQAKQYWKQYQEEPNHAR